MFYADPFQIKSSGDNCGFIFDAATVFHVGESFELKPNDELLVIPCMPHDEGPWKQYRTIVRDERGILCKEVTIMGFMIRNQWPRKSVKIDTGVSLAGLMETWGIGHDMSFTTEKDLVSMQELQPEATKDEKKQMPPLVKID